MKLFPDETEKEDFITKIIRDVATAIDNPNTVILIPNQ